MIYAQGSIWFLLAFAVNFSFSCSRTPDMPKPPTARKYNVHIEYAGGSDRYELIYKKMDVDGRELYLARRAGTIVKIIIVEHAARTLTIADPASRKRLVSRYETDINLIEGLYEKANAIAGLYGIGIFDKNIAILDRVKVNSLESELANAAQLIKETATAKVYSVGDGAKISFETAESEILSLNEIIAAIGEYAASDDFDARAAGFWWK